MKNKNRFLERQCGISNYKAANSRWNFTGFMRTVKINMTWTTTIKNPNKQ